MSVPILKLFALTVTLWEHLSVSEESKTPTPLPKRSKKLHASHPANKSQTNRFFFDVLNRNDQFGNLIKLPLSYLSASTVVVLLFLTTVLFALTRIPDIITFTVVIAIVILAYGWKDLVEAPSEHGGLITILSVGIPNLLVIRLTGDLAWAGISLGITVLVAALYEMSRPLPRENLVESLASSVFGGIVAIVGSAWVALESSQLWATILLACTVMVAAAVVGNQFGSTLRANAIGAILGGAFSGVVLGFIAVAIDTHQRFLHLALNSFLMKVSPTIGILLLTISLGLALGAVITAIDALFGEHNRKCSEKGAFARGAMKFLLAVLPIYVLVRTGAF
ncbi:hypothetical protein HMPREF0044_0335 [Gleimia coleocanis DSM 15436]|uniref:Uncharacterized protein n=1 Tax=Gleimia coleocanis DSM 15436 TaxID=525245 RepID=C0VYU5_9ACTO|nr:hypothetical protein HMPREF0044_0335 [Gleimia coleocanis DSM 15436]